MILSRPRFHPVIIFLVTERKERPSEFVMMLSSPRMSVSPSVHLYLDLSLPLLVFIFRSQALQLGLCGQCSQDDQVNVLFLFLYIFSTLKVNNVPDTSDVDVSNMISCSPNYFFPHSLCFTCGNLPFVFFMSMSDIGSLMWAHRLNLLFHFLFSSVTMAKVLRCKSRHKPIALCYLECGKVSKLISFLTTKSLSGRDSKIV